MKNTYFDFFGVTFEVSGQKGICDLLRKDFEYFGRNSLENPYYHLRIHHEKPPLEKTQGLKAVRRRRQCITYKPNGLLINNYQGQALSTLSRKLGEMDIYSFNHDLLHELAYLAILSLSGKDMDLKGMHKIHAFGLYHQKNIVLGMMKSGVGKSTLLLDLLKRNPDSKIISDDTPVIDTKGEIYSFPSRVGINNKSDHGEFLREDSLYTLERREYGLKTLVPFSSLGREAFSSEEVENIYLFEGKRRGSSGCQVQAVGKMRIFLKLIPHMIIGVGLPMILEYFLEPSLKDIPKRFRIIFLRTFAAIRLCFRSESFIIYLGTDRESNCQAIESFMKP